MQDMGNGKFRDGEWEYSPVGECKRTGQMLYDKRRWEFKPYNRNDPIPEEILEHVARVFAGKDIGP